MATNEMATNKAGSREYSYTVAPHLSTEYDVPISDFVAAHPQYTRFVVGGFIFTNRKQGAPPASASQNAKSKLSAANTGPPKQEPLMLIMQRSKNDKHGGYWDFPGGSLEPTTDQTLLDGVAREVLEETGYHVSKIRDLVRVDSWDNLHPEGRTTKVAKYSFVVDVHEMVDTVEWEEKVRLSPDEHSKWVWVTREEIEESVKAWRNGKLKDAPYLFFGVQGETAGEAWKTYSALIVDKVVKADTETKI